MHARTRTTSRMQTVGLHQHASGHVAASSQVFVAASRSSPASAPCSCRPLSHKTLLWHHRLGHPSLPRLRGMASRTLVSDLPRSLPPLPPGPAPTCVPCVEGRQRAAPHSSTFPPTEAPLQTHHMDVWGPARVRGQGHEHYFLLVVDDNSRYTTVFPLCSKGEVPEVLIDWIRGARHQLSECFGSDLHVLRLHSDRGGEFSSDLLRAFCRAEGIRQMFTLLTSPQQNGIVERRIGMVMDVARTSMIHAAPPHFLWPFAVQYAAHQINRSLRAAKGPRRAGATRASGRYYRYSYYMYPGGARTTGTGAAGAGGVGGAGAGGPGDGGTGARDPGAGGIGVGGAGSGGTGFEDSLTECHEPESCTALPARAVRIGHRVPRPRPPPDPGTHIMALRLSFVPLRVPLPSPPPSSLADDPDPEFDLARAASPTVPRLLATDPSFESTVAPALVAELVDFATACRLDYATSLEDFECLAVAVPHLVAMLLAPEGDLDAPDIPTPRSYTEAITGSYSSHRQTAMDVEMASWKSTGTYIDEVPPHEVNIVDGMWIFRGVDFFQTFSPTPKMTTLWLLLHVAAYRDYELHSLDFSTTFLQGNLHEEIWLRRPPGFTGSFPAGT
ncbi:unnamed protein product [Closterium sp. NIES-53]